MVCVQSFHEATAAAAMMVTADNMLRVVAVKARV